MALTGYLKIPDIEGESDAAEHEKEIDVFGVSWGIEQDTDPRSRFGRFRRKAEAAPLTISKWYDASSPYLALAVQRGKAFDEVVFSARKDSGDAHLDYLVITMTNCTITNYEMANLDDDAQIQEQVEIEYERIAIKYVVQADDHSAGDEHEVEFDLVSGV